MSSADRSSGSANGPMRFVTGRNTTLPVTPMSSMARSLSFTPGRLTTIVSPWRRISGSADAERVDAVAVDVGHDIEGVGVEAPHRAAA